MKISSFFKPLSFLPAIALMYMIYSFSAQPADSSSSTSFYISRKVVQAVDLVAQKNWEDWQINERAAQINGIVRKGAHMTEYFLLAIAVSFPLYVYGVRGILLMILAGVICVAYACGDEYHQSLVSGRAARARDVLIDSVGVLLGVIFTRLIGWSGRMAITGPMYERRQKKQQRELDAREEELARREEALQREERRLRMARSSERRAQPMPQRPDSARQYPPVNAGSSGPVPAAGQFPRQHSAPSGNAPAGSQYSWQNAGSSGIAPSGGQFPPEAVRAPMPPEGAPQSRPYPRQNVDDRTRVVGTKHEIDDRTRVYRSEEEQRRMEEAYKRQRYERMRVQSEELQEDSTSDRLSEDLPFSKLFRRKE